MALPAYLRPRRDGGTDWAIEPSPRARCYSGSMQEILQQMLLDYDHMTHDERVCFENSCPFAFTVVQAMREAREVVEEVRRAKA